MLTMCWKVMKLENLSPMGDPKCAIPLVRVSALLEMPEKVVWRYFWGLKTVKGGPPISVNQAQRFECAFRQKMSCGAVMSNLSGHMKPNHPDLLTQLQSFDNTCSSFTQPRDGDHATITNGPLHTCPTQSGLSAIYSLGERSISLPDAWSWRFKEGGKLSPDVVFQLRPGLKGRHIFGPKSKLAGRCFEWQVVPDSISKLPKFEISEFELTDHGVRASRRKVTAHTPNALWNRLFTEVLGLPAPDRGAQLCGFHDESLADLLGVSKAESFSTFKELKDLCHRRGNQIAAAASVEFKHAMKSVCPNNPHLAFEALRSTAAWQSEWYDEESEDWSNYLVDLPFVRGMVTAHEHAPKESKMAILSLFAPYFSSKQTCALFQVTKHAVTAARLHDANAMGGQQLRRQTYERMRLSPRTFAFLHQWNRSTFAVTAGDASSSNFKRLEIRQRLYDRYKVMAEQELRVTAVSRDCFNKSMRDGFTDETVDTCCCGGCCDGWSALSMLQDFVSDPQYGFKDWKVLAKSVVAIREFLKGDYRWKHLRESSAEAMHCMHYALYTLIKIIELSTIKINVVCINSQSL
jgi:hypothetical protein